MQPRNPNNNNTKKTVDEKIIENLEQEMLTSLINNLNQSTGKEAALNKQYKKESLRYHPDKNPDDEKAKAVFQSLGCFYTILDKMVKNESLRPEISDSELKHFKETLNRCDKETKKNFENINSVTKAFIKNISPTSTQDFTNKSTDNRDIGSLFAGLKSRINQLVLVHSKPDRQDAKQIAINQLQEALTNTIPEKIKNGEISYENIIYELERLLTNVYNASQEKHLNQTVNVFAKIGITKSGASEGANAVLGTIYDIKMQQNIPLKPEESAPSPRGSKPG